MLPVTAMTGSQLRQPHHRTAAAGSSSRLPTPTRRLVRDEEDEDHHHAGGMRLDHADQGVPLPGLYLLVVEEFVGRMWLCSGRPAAE